jgi:hypothetical protein
MTAKPVRPAAAVVVVALPSLLPSPSPLPLLLLPSPLHPLLLRRRSKHLLQNNGRNPEVLTECFRVFVFLGAAAGCGVRR